MALTTTQVNTAFLAALARPAEGQAAAWGAGSLSLDALLNNIFIAENTDDFVESLYTELLGRASDAEGKAFWNALLATTSKEVVLAQFKAAVLQAGVLDPSNADYQGFIATSKDFVKSLYTNLLGREADTEGLDFWSQALANGMSQGDLLAQFTAAALAGGADSDDYQTITAKLAVADAFSAKFFAFNADVTADEKKAALQNLVDQMSSVTAGTTIEDVEEDMNLFVGNFQNRTSQVFTKAEDDDLDASEATAATSFRGTVNLVDATKGTIQTGDTVTGNTDFNDTLVVNVTSDSTHKLLDLNGDLPARISNVEKLIINNGSANVEGDLNDANFSESVSITGTGDVNLKVNSSLKDLSVSSATKGDVAITVNSDLTNYTGGNAGESVTVAGSIKNASLGAGDDSLVINGTVEAQGAIDLGAGNDELVINSNISFADINDNITLDGGAGSKDTLVLNTANIYGVKSIKGFETIDAKYWTEAGENIGVIISAEAANGLKAKLTDGSGLAINGSEGTTTINLSGLSVDKGDIALVYLRNLTKETITLSKTVQENIFLSGATEPKNITIKGFVNGGDLLYVGQNDTVSIATGAKNADLSKAGQVLDLLNSQTLSAGTNYVAINTNNEKASYIWKVEGTTATRDNITLVATVDKALSKTDFANGSQPGPVPPTPGETADLVYNETYNTLEVQQKISGETVVGVDETAKDKVASAEAIVINAAGADISFDKKALATGTGTIKKVTVQSDANTTNTLDLSNLSATTKANITTIADTAGNANFTLNETMASLTTVNLGAGNDTLTLGENFSGAATITVDAGDGDDTVDLTALAASKINTSLTINGASGNDTVKLGAETYANKVIFDGVETIVGMTNESGATSTIGLNETTKIATKSSNDYTLNAFELQGDLVLTAAASTTTVDASAVTGSGNLTIDLNTQTTVTSVTGSTNKDIVKVGAAATTLASLENVEAIFGSASAAEVKLALFGADSTVAEIGGTLTIDTTGATEAINLSALKALNNERTTLTTKAVAKDITLSADANIKDVVTLANITTAPKEISIANALAGDKINVGALGTSVVFAAFEKGTQEIDDNKAYLVVDTTRTKAEIIANITDYFTAANTKTGVAVLQANDGIAIYQAEDDSTDVTLKLLATVDATEALAEIGTGNFAIIG